MDLPPFWPLTPPLEIESNVSDELAMANEDDDINYNMMMEALELEARDIEDALAVSVSDLQRPSDVDLEYSEMDEDPQTSVTIGDLNGKYLDKKESEYSENTKLNEVLTELNSVDSAKKSVLENNIHSNPSIFTEESPTKEKHVEDETLEDLQFENPLDTTPTIDIVINDEQIFRPDDFNLNDSFTETHSQSIVSKSPTLGSLQFIKPEINNGQIWSPDNFLEDDEGEFLSNSQLQFAKFDPIPERCFIPQNNEWTHDRAEADDLKVNKDDFTQQLSIPAGDNLKDFSSQSIRNDYLDSKSPSNNLHTDKDIPDNDDFQEFSSTLPQDYKIEPKKENLIKPSNELPINEDTSSIEQSIPAAEDDFQAFSSSQDYEEFSNFESFSLKDSLQTTDTVEVTEDVIFSNISEWIISYKQNMPDKGSDGDVAAGSSPSLCRFQLGETWKQLLDGDDRQPYLRNWISSFCRQMLLKAINIDPANLLNFNPSFPRFVSTQNLTPAVIATSVESVTLTTDDVGPLSTPVEPAPVITLRDSHIFTPANTTLPQVETFQSGELLPQKCENTVSGSSYYMPDFEFLPPQPSVSQTVETVAIHSPQNFEQNILQPTLVIPSVPVVKWPNPGQVKEQGFIDFMTEISPVSDINKSKQGDTLIIANSIPSIVNPANSGNTSNFNSDFGSIFSQVEQLSTSKPSEQPSADEFSDFQTADSLTLSTTSQILVPVSVSSVPSPATNKVILAKRTEYEVLRPVALDDRFSPLFPNKSLDVYQPASSNRPLDEDDWSDFVSGPFKAQTIVDQDEWTEYIGGGTLPSASSSELRTISGKVSTRLSTRQPDLDLPSLEFSNPNFNKTNDYPRL